MKKKRLPPAVAHWLAGKVDTDEKRRHGNPDGWRLNRLGHWVKEGKRD